MIYVIYGSQTGNSEEIAKRIFKETKEKIQSENVELVVMNKFLSMIQKFPEKKEQTYVIIAVCSTTGAGDAPGNCDNFIRWIKRKTHAEDTLSNVQYTVLGLGDSNYTKYQCVPRQVDDGFSKIGAKKFYSRGEADDAYGLEIVVEPWIDGLYPSLEKLIGEIKSRKPIDLISTNSEVPIKLHPTENKVLEAVNSVDHSHFNLQMQLNKYLNAKIVSKCQISGKRSEREIYTMQINPSNSERELNFTNYQPGAHISIIPPESEDRIKKILTVISITDKFLLIDKSNNFKIYSDFSEKFPHFKKMLSKGFLAEQEVLTYILDFNSVLKKSQVENIRLLLKEKVDNKELVLKFDNLFNKYTELILRNRISLFDIILSLSMYNIKLNLSLSDLVEFFPIKYPRNYSLLSYGYEQDVNPLEIVFSVVRDRIVRNFGNVDVPMGFKSGEFYFKGQSSNFLKNSQSGQEILISSIGNCFEFPLNDFLNEQKPIVYLCNGTGIAPCISFLKKLLTVKDKINPHLCGELLIFTGFRSASDDKKETIYEDFITQATEKINETWGRNAISYFRCLSNALENEEEEVGIWRNCRINTSYVQDLIIEHDEKIHEQIFKKNGYLMICGDIQKLYDECINNVMSIFMRKENLIRENCVKYIEDMKISNRMIIEKWI